MKNKFFLFLLILFGLFFLFFYFNSQDLVDSDSQVKEDSVKFPVFNDYSLGVLNFVFNSSEFNNYTIDFSFNDGDLLYIYQEGNLIYNSSINPSKNIPFKFSNGENSFEVFFLRNEDSNPMIISFKGDDEDLYFWTTSESSGTLKFEILVEK